MIKRRALLLITIGLLALLLCVGPARATYGTYDDLLISTFGSHLIALWPLNETSGATAYDISGNSRNGTYHGVTLDQTDGAGASFGRAGLFDGINDYVDIQSTSLQNAFTPDAFTISMWAEVSSSAIWTDGTYRHAFDIHVDASANRLLIRRTASNNQLGATSNGKTSLLNAVSDTAWINLILVGSQANNTLILYKNNAAGTSDTFAAIGTSWIYAGLGKSSDGAWVWSGYLQHVVILNYAASSEDRAILANASPPEPTPTPTNTPTSIAQIQAISTLENGQPWLFDYTITAGQVATFIPDLLLIGLVVVGILFMLLRRR